ncbi:FBP domain-containing protein [Streptomyces sp. NBC_01498]|uniref:FBP domain-containing protein n=1 Tax=Streptomyces sp. NBC_01498 TaxID=2975870 RepID=UPI002E7B2965|nr:FBP domain-containing protein [Streptomyces sp. NBC_01498]WTL23372.1 FBP domain-containing protein [Streptomyces sp. NBC_01498]
MKAVTERDIRASFVNCSKGEAQRLPLPRGFAELPWEDLDFLGWLDLSAPDRAYLVVQRDDVPGDGTEGDGEEGDSSERDGTLVGVTLRYPSRRRGFLHRTMCSLCLTTHPGGGVSLMAARKRGRAGREGNSVGLYMCTDLACSLYVRGKKAAAPGSRMEETLTVEQQTERLRANLLGFLDQLGP